MAAITAMQHNPKEVMLKYGSNSEFMMLFQEYCKVIGSHFAGMTEPKPIAKTEAVGQRIQELSPVDEE